jgi:phospholipid N-methyltransferase
MEIDAGFCALLRQEIADPRLRVVQAPAQQVAAQVAALGRPLEAVVSGLPFANFPLTLRREIVQAAYDTLSPGGVFSGYGYAPFALPPVLRETFGNCQFGFVWRNVPPAFTFTARKPAR